MNTFTKVHCVYLILFTQTKGVFLSTCGESNFNETIKKEEYALKNISFAVNLTVSSYLSEKFVAWYEVCENNVKKKTCSFIRKNEFSNIDGKNQALREGVYCFGRQRNVSSSVVTLDIQISQLVTRSLSVMILSTGADGIPKPTRLIRVEVLYPAKITNLTVDGVEANSDYIIDEGKEVNVSCFFEKGALPGFFYMLDKNGTELKSSYDGRSLSYLLTAQCENDSPMVRCTANGTQQNRFVIFLVRCPPQFVDKSLKRVSPSAFPIKFRVKAHTKNITECRLTPMSFEDNTREVNCILSGSLPDLVLSISLENLTNSVYGNWTVTLCNEIGSANITFIVLRDSTALSHTALPPTLTSGEKIEIWLVPGIVMCVIVITVAIVARRVLGQKHKEVVRRPDEKRNMSDNLQGNVSTMIVNNVYEASGGADTLARHSCSPATEDLPLSPTSSDVPARPPHSRVESEDSQSKTYNSYEADENIYASAPEVRQKKRLQKKGQPDSTEDDTYVSAKDVRKGKEKKRQKLDAKSSVDEAPNTFTNTAETVMCQVKPSCNRNADGLIYSDLVFTNISSSKVITRPEEKTEYADIKVTATSLRTGRKKTK